MEKVIISVVVGPNEYGWYQIGLGDGRLLGTNQEEIAQKASGLMGQEAEVDIALKQKGTYFNLYLNSID